MTQASFILVMSYIALLSAGVFGAPPSPRRRRGDCPDRCGNITIPYPFGIGPDCSLMPGFRVRCNASGLFTGGIRIGSITLETAQMVVLRPLTYSCNMTGAIPRTRNMSLLLTNTAFLVSPDDNVFTAVGCGTAARLSGITGGARYLTGCMSTCVLNRTGEDGGPCRGLGCCEASLATGLNLISVRWFQSIRKNTCQYAFVAERGWYNFSRAHLNKNTFAKKYGNGEVIPLVLDWAIGREGKKTCTSQLPYGVCISSNSHCVNPSNGAAGYFCRCNKGYTGNSYQKDGCTDINECTSKMSEDLYPCHGGKCLNVEGDYECKCNFGRRGNGKSNKGCEHVLSQVAAAMIGTTIVISLSAVLLVLIHMEHEKRRLRDRFNKNGGRLLNNIKIEVFRKEDLDKITKNYSTIIGRGAFGEVYKGTTSGYVPVAVKRSIAINEERQKDFANEIQIQSQISHKYIVQLLGCCLETEVPMLVYEFVPMGSLHDVLHGKNGKVRRNPISLRARLSIAICSADALAYMHSQANQKILHGDVKSGNILLDDEFVPKVSDFGTSRLMSIEKDHTNLVIGDSSYIDPVYMKTGLLTEKSDVYSFGIVLLELITRKKPRYGGNNSLPLNYVRASMEGATGQMYDTEILSSGQDAKCLGEIGLIAVQCLEVDVDDRPTMTEVAEKIKRCKSRWLQSHWHGKTKAL